jgi:hypothetical protein
MTAPDPTPTTSVPTFGLVTRTRFGHGDIGHQAQVFWPLHGDLLQSTHLRRNGRAV